ncbi:hypothetical protein [Staphylococcus aureus]|uniref:hypothetical protein n=1 Tax=Staphylococcus aureus TaxID=1280 RepID=UPI002163B63B|nr:hypothetical protein [Staphylococcus aureus]
MKIALLNVITNGFVEKRGKVYADDRYAFNYNRRNGHWTATNIDAEKRNRRAEMGNGAWFIAMGYLGFLLFFVGAYMIIMYLLSSLSPSALSYTCTTNIKRFKK